MIKCNMGIVGVKGSKELIKAELGTLIFVLKNDKILPDDDIKEAVEDALKFDPEDAVPVSKELVSILDKLIKILGEE